MADYLKEFPDFVGAEMPKLPEGFVDASWKNEVCPAWDNAALGLRIWIEHPDPEKREFVGEDDPGRFFVQRVTGASFGDHILVSDNWAEVEVCVETERARKAAYTGDDLLGRLDGLAKRLHMEGHYTDQIIVEAALTELRARKQ